MQVIVYSWRNDACKQLEVVKPGALLKIAPRVVVVDGLADVGAVGFVVVLNWGWIIGVLDLTNEGEEDFGVDLERVEEVMLVEQVGGEHV